MNPPAAVVATALLATLLSSGLARGQVVGDFGENIAVVEVEVPVRVLLEGRPVRDLRATDFEILVEGAVQQIVGFQVLDLVEQFEETVAPAPAGAVPASRHIMILFDRLFSQPRFLTRALKATRTMVAQQLHPTDALAVGVYSAAGLQLLSGFTDDRRETELALDVFDATLHANRDEQRTRRRELSTYTGRRYGNTPADRRRRRTAQFGLAAALALEIGAGSSTAPWSAVAADDAPTDRTERFTADSTTPGAILGQLSSASPEELAETLSGGSTLSAIRGFARRMAEMATLLREIPGQKQLLLLSQGFDSSLLQDAAVLSHLQRWLEAFRRSNWSVQAIDIEGIPEAGRRGFDAEALFYLAHGTGGELFENFNRLEVATRKIIERTAVTYLLTFQLADVVADGQYREIKVELPNGPKRARLAHRPGYYAPKPVAHQNAMERRVNAIELLLSGTEQLEFDAQIDAFPPLSGGAEVSVPIIVEIASAELAFKRARRGLTLEIHAYCFTLDGELEELLSKTINIEGRKVEKLLDQEEGGLRLVAALQLAAGEHELRVLVRDQRTGKTHLSSRRLSVSTPQRGEPALQRPLFVGLSRPWLLVDSRSRAAGAPTPFAIGGQRRIPSLRPVLEPGAATAIVIKGAHLDDGSTKIRARVLDLEGNPVTGGELKLDQRWLDEAGQLDGLTATFTAKDLLPGSYQLEIAAVSAIDSEEITASSRFAVAGAPARIEN